MNFIEQKPTIYYKFHALDKNLVQLLSCEKFYCATYDQLNDPYDIRVRFSESIIRGWFTNQKSSFIKVGMDIDFIFREFVEKIHYSNTQLEGINDFINTKAIDEKVSLIKSFENEFSTILLKHIGNRVTCFTINENLSPDDILMWAHYSSIFNGVKLKFDFDDVHGRMNILSKMSEVTYRQREIVDTAQQYYKEIFNKVACWQYENEYRLISINHPFIPFERSHLKEIIFGYNIKREDRNAFIRMIYKLGYLSCDFSQLKFINGELKKVWINYNPKHNEYFVDGVSLKGID